MGYHPDVYVNVAMPPEPLEGVSEVWRGECLNCSAEISQGLGLSPHFPNLHFVLQSVSHFHGLKTGAETSVH